VTTPAAVIVAMTPAHVDALMPYEQDMFGTEAWSRNAYLGELADRRHRYYLVAEDTGGGLLGWAGILIVGTTADILTVGVVPDARRRGIARRLVAALLAEATRRGVGECFLEVRTDNAAAIELYTSEGFTEVGVRRGYYDAGRADAMVMRRETPGETASGLRGDPGR
jgi:[ribosomal protein S18]-alanine N-acetyltransferase